MAHYDLEEQEQIDTLKTWWKMYGNLVTGVVVAASLGVVGWQGWNWYQRSQSARRRRFTACSNRRRRPVMRRRSRLQPVSWPRSLAVRPTPRWGAMVAAKQSFDAGDLKTAKTQLSWVPKTARTKSGIWPVCVWLPCNSTSRPTTRRSSNWMPSMRRHFDVRFLELKGDVLSAQGKNAEARAAYKAALDKMTDKGRPGANCCSRSSTALARLPDVSPVASPAAAAGLLLAGCATVSDTLDSINPFASSGPKMARFTSDHRSIRGPRAVVGQHRQGGRLYVHAGRRRQEGFRCRP
jgi:hypothetical protein